MVRAASGLCRALARRGHQVSVVTARLDRAHALDEERDGVRVRRLHGPRLLSRRLFPWAPDLPRVLERELGPADVAHVHGHRNGLAVAARGVLERSGKPWLLQPHGTFPEHGRHVLLKRLLDRVAGDRVVSAARALVAVSQAEARDLPRPARVIPNGVEALGRAASSGSGPVPTLLFVGNEQPQKRAGVLEGLLEQLPSARLVLVGRYGSRLLARLRRFGSRVVVEGVLEGDSMARAYATADVLVHPAVGEAFGLAPFEAALHGTPAVVAGGHGSGEWYGRAGGCVVAPDSPRALLEAVRSRLEDAELGRQEAGRVAAFASRELSWERAAQAMESLYAELVSGPSEGVA
jgi:glycosyltransferase involved in cell wall biosynthesis